MYSKEKGRPTQLYKIPKVGSCQFRVGSPQIIAERHSAPIRHMASDAEGDLHLFGRLSADHPTEDVGLDAEARRTAYHSRPVLAHTVASLNHRHIIHLGNKHPLQITV